MNVYLILAVVLLVLAGGGLVAGLAARRRALRRHRALASLLDLADHLELDLKACRERLHAAHQVIALNPDHPAASEQEARGAVDAGLRALLQQRLWIRDHAGRADAGELAAAGDSMRHIRARLGPLLAALGQAQTELDSATREHIRRDATP